jgi:hypothetical protein
MPSTSFMLIYISVRKEEEKKIKEGRKRKVCFIFSPLSNTVRFLFVYYIQDAEKRKMEFIQFTSRLLILIF